MKYGKKLLTPPSIEPLTLIQVKSRLRVTQTDDDNEFTDIWIPAVRQLVEKYTGRAMITQTWRLTYDSFPYGVGQRYSVGNDAPVGFNAAGVTYGNSVMYDVGFLLPLQPLQTVGQIQYYDSNNALQVLDPTYYEVDPATNPPRVMPVFNAIWPTTYPRTSALMIDVTIGFGDAAANVPPDLLAAMLLQIGDWYEAGSPADDLSSAVKSLLALNWSASLE